MATNYFSNTPPGAASSTTNIAVDNIPANYFLNVGSKIDLKSGADTFIRAGGKATVEAGGDATILSDGGIVAIKSVANKVTVDAASNVYVTAGVKTIIDAPETDILHNTVLGTDVGVDTTEFKSKIKSDILPKDQTFNVGGTSDHWNKSFFEEGEYFSGNNVGNQYLQYGPNGRPYDPADIYDTAAHRKTGAVYLHGGMGIEKDLNVGGRIYGRIEIANTSFQIVVTATNADIVFHPLFARSTGEQFLFVDTQGIDQDGNAGLIYNPYTGKLGTELIKVVSTSSANAIDGAIRVEGGISVGKNIVTQQITPTDDADATTSTYSVGTSSTQWAEAYVHDIYTRVIASTTGTIEMHPQAGVVDMFSDIRVRGQNPIGTAPVVTNILYVTMDGNDTNDGRAMDPSRACRTIGGALKSPYYQSGTQIRVAPGHYLEDNPLQLKPYTSIMGSDLRTCSVEPINKTQDLFHMNSGCYMAFMQFLNGRSGLLEGQYDPQYNRGAYCTSFPPLEGDARIDLFHSPYIQNCTNLSGPWLKDGTMFVPNETVQIPKVTAFGTWTANTTTILVKAIGTGTISRGDYVNAGQQNPGFFEARTLMLANKPFLQEQVVAYVDATFNSGSFSYNLTKCQRDIGLILDSISTDMLYDNISDSTFAGLQYWHQSSSAIAGEQTTTTNAINYLKGLAATVALNAGGASVQTTVNTLFTNITNIITNGTVGVSDIIVANGLPSTDIHNTAAYTALLANKATLKTQVLTWIGTNYPTFVYNTSTCARDVGYIIDSVAFDVLHGGNRQSIKSGVYYYNYSTTSTQIVNEIPQTTLAYSFIKSIIPNIVTGVPLPTVYQTGTTQVILGQPIASSYEAISLQNKIDIITDIIRHGPDVAVDKTPEYVAASYNEERKNAFNLLLTNKNFIKAEVIAFLDKNLNTFDYSKEYCYRDVGILVENVAYDAAFGGNEKSIQSGLAYFNGVISKISGQETQTSAAIDYLNKMVQSVITNNTWTSVLTVPAVVAPHGTHSQVRNTVMTRGAVASGAINQCFNTITTIISNGPAAAPAMYKSGGPDAAFVSAEILMQANRRFIQEDTINWINNTVKAFPYSRIKCKRDINIIVDSIAYDLLYPTAKRSQSTFSALQYWSQGNYTGIIESQLGPTLDAMKYLKELSVKVVQNITPTDDLINRYQSAVSQNTSLEPASSVEAALLAANFDIVISIVKGNNKGWTDKIVPNGPETNLLGIKNAFNLLEANKSYLAAEVIAYITAIHPNFTSYSTSTCARDVGLITDSIAFDLKHGGNRQSIQAGLSYYSLSSSTNTIHGQETQTIVAFNRIKEIVNGIMTGNLVAASTGTILSQVVLPDVATSTEVNYVQQSISTITDIIIYGPSISSGLTSIALTASNVTSVINGFNLLQANKKFIVDDVIHFIDWNYNKSSFDYNEELCYRDTGLIVDAVSQDILLGGNYKSLEAGLAYWNFGYNHVQGQETTTTMAINYARDLALQIIANTPVTPQTQTSITQVINPFFEYGGDYMPQEAVKRNFKIITDIIQKGPKYAPPRYMGGGLFALVGVNGADVKISPRVTSVTTVSTATYLIGLDTPTVGFGNHSTLYFGDILTYPKQDAEVEALSLEYTGDATTWNQRKVDPIGGMGGSLVDGAVISARSPINSFVYDAFTQLTQGGRGVRITNDGYAQLVSVFTIFASTGVQVDNGGIASIVNSNANFGDLCLVAKGYGQRKFSGTVYNPVNKAYPDDAEFNQYYPTGYWPNNARARIFIPDLVDRPHISLVMEVVPPDTMVDYTGSTVPQANEQGFPGFLNAIPNLGILTTGTITITGIDTTGVAVGNTLYVRDQNGNQTGTNGILYAATGTIVTDVGYQSVTLNKALTSGGADPTNTASSINNDYFNLYFCGNAYYTVLSSEIGDNPLPVGTNVIRDVSTGDQRPAHISALQRLQSIVLQAIKNQTITTSSNYVVTHQVFQPLLTDGGFAETFINQRFENLIQIIDPRLATPAQPDTLAGAEAVVKPALRTKTGPAVQGAGSAISLIEQNMEFFAEEIYAYVQANFTITYNKAKCQRDVKLILQRLMYDIETGGRYNTVMSGLSYWQRDGTHHLIQLGENITRTDLLPDGATVNFYQRSYISASGYVFEYVGAGTNYGALPQVGRADPVQTKETVQLDSGKVFFTSTDQNGDFRIGPGLVISQATGVLSGRTFTKSLFANMTPFILAIEAG